VYNVYELFHTRASLHQKVCWTPALQHLWAALSFDVVIRLKRFLFKWTTDSNNHAVVVQEAAF
jgi:hypothetical protein